MKKRMGLVLMMLISFFSVREVCAQEAAPAAPVATEAAAPVEKKVVKPTAAEYGVIMNLSGKQRMLSQKMTKEALLIQAGVNADENKGNLKATTDLFKKTLKGLRDGDESLGLPVCRNPRVIKQLDKVKGLYEALDPIFTKAINGEELTAGELSKLAQENLPVLKNANKVVKMFERGSREVLVSKGELGVVINLAGKQRMLTQKMSKEALLIYLGVDKDNNILEIRQTSFLFDKTLKGLKDGDADLGLPGTKEGNINAQLAIVEGLWKNFYPIMQKASDVTTASISEEELKTVADLNVPLLKAMNKAVGMYADLAK